ncbi:MULTISPECIES: ABC transporter permease [unclassified Beijerinckia]|uniref:ABC transporter permease n=1 Tax=unclassified Beijerinckia TaxID=2638183 RepID=UPI00089D0582|nr:MULTISPECIES: ABC transporter permease [unclassified Beijerinckia]MDH7799210.1 ABC-type nitrate/sulfonate/bicarbonate transport system permease component [Beijerinckia sp. GAS462]SED91875.1 NitT/TauT family transport system permease protein [Beijerinckia sp. 28-YEA-48]
MMSGVKRNISILALAILWELAPRVGLVRMDSLPPISHIAVAWFQLARDGELFIHAGMSLGRAGAGLLIAVITGSVLGVSMATWTPIRLLFRPLMEAFYPIPKSALIPVTALWLGLGDASKVVLIALGCILPVTIGAYNGARGCERVLIWSARGMGASKLRTLIDVVVPSALPELLNGIRTALALAFVLLVSAELIVAKNGLGYLIGLLGGTGQYDGMFAVVLTIAGIGLLADRLYARFTSSVLSWQ